MVVCLLWVGPSRLYYIEHGAFFFKSLFSMILCVIWLSVVYKGCLYDHMMLFSGMFEQEDVLCVKSAILGFVSSSMLM